MKSLTKFLIRAAAFFSPFVLRTCSRRALRAAIGFCGHFKLRRGGGFEEGETLDTGNQLVMAAGGVELDRGAANPIRPVIDSTFALDDIVVAFAHQESQKHFGKICLEF